MPTYSPHQFKAFVDSLNATGLTADPNRLAAATAALTQACGPAFMAAYEFSFDGTPAAEMQCLGQDRDAARSRFEQILDFYGLDFTSALAAQLAAAVSANLAGEKGEPVDDDDAVGRASRALFGAHVQDALEDAFNDHSNEELNEILTDAVIREQALANVLSILEELDRYDGSTTEITGHYLVEVTATVSTVDHVGQTRTDLTGELRGEIDVTLSDQMRYTAPEPGDLIQETTTVTVATVPATHAMRAALEDVKAAHGSVATRELRAVRAALDVALTRWPELA